MKVRITFPEEVSGNVEKAKQYVDDILLWGLEVDMNVDFYGFYREFSSEPVYSWRNRWRHGIFIIEPEYAFMFSLKWGALQHKTKKKSVKE